MTVVAAGAEYWGAEDVTGTSAVVVVSNMLPNRCNDDNEVLSAELRRGSESSEVSNDHHSREDSSCALSGGGKVNGGWV